MAGGKYMDAKLNFEDLSRLIGATVLSCDEKGYSQGEYVIEEYDSDHDWISISNKENNEVKTLWPEDLYMWHFRFPGTETKTSEEKYCPLKFELCTRKCAWFSENTGFCAVFRQTDN